MLSKVLKSVENSMIEVGSTLLMSSQGAIQKFLCYSWILYWETTTSHFTVMWANSPGLQSMLSISCESYIRPFQPFNLLVFLLSFASPSEFISCEAEDNITFTWQSYSVDFEALFGRVWSTQQSLVLHNLYFLYPYSNSLHDFQKFLTTMHAAVILKNNNMIKLKWDAIWPNKLHCTVY